jgi:hypothetical protein
VGQPSSADLLLVQTGAPDESYLVYKIRGTQSQVSGGNSSRMPKRSILSAAQIAVIESWITNGAPP